MCPLVTGVILSGSLQMCLWLINQVSILAESCWSVLIFHQTVQCLHPISISFISNWVRVKNIISFLEGERNSSQTAHIPSLKGKWVCLPLHFGMRMDLGCWSGTILWGDEALFTSKYEQPCGWKEEQQPCSWQTECAVLWHAAAPRWISASDTCTHVPSHRAIHTLMIQQLPSAKRKKKE